MKEFFAVCSAQSLVETSTQDDVGHNFLRRAVLDFLQDSSLRVEHITIHHNEFGKPFVKINGNDSGVNVSLSYKDDVVGVGVSLDNTWVGVDIEKIKEFNPIVVEGFLTKEELYALALYDGKDYMSNVTKLWCYKESVMKATGLGLRLHPKRINAATLIQLKEGDVGLCKIDEQEIACTINKLFMLDGYVFLGVTFKPFRL